MQQTLGVLGMQEAASPIPPLHLTREGGRGASLQLCPFWGSAASLEETAGRQSMPT